MKQETLDRIKVAKTAGYCFGVNRAVKLVYNEAEKSDKKVATLGPIIHNSDVVNDMMQKGVRIIESVSELEDGEEVIIRSHGVGSEVYEELKKDGKQYIDATCPFVARIHEIVNEKTKEGYFILIAGDKGHPEVQGIVGHCDENYYVFKDQFELNDFFSKKFRKIKKKLAITAGICYYVFC